MRRSVAFSLLLRAHAALAVLLAASRPAMATPAQYDIDQRYATIRFSTGLEGGLQSEGRFLHFRGHLVIDYADPRACAVDVTVDDAMIDMSPAFGIDTLRSGDYFDSARYPTILFRSTAVDPLSPAHFAIHGIMTIRGVERPETFDAILVDAPNPTQPIARFSVSGTIRRSDFGMVADQALVSDVIGLSIQATLQKPEVMPR